MAEADEVLPLVGDMCEAWRELPPPTTIAIGAASDMRAVLSRVETYNNNSHGIVLDGSGTALVPRAMVADSIAANNVGTDIIAVSAEMQVVRTVSAYNASGVIGSAATVRIGQSTVTGNTTGTAGVSSYGDNNIDGNSDGNRKKQSGRQQRIELAVTRR